MITVTCPKCGAKKTAAPNMQVTCPSCKATLHVDNNGNVKKAVSR